MIAVTGGAGFIGSNIVRGFNQRGEKNILVVDDLSESSKHRNLNRLEFIDYVDYRDFINNIETYPLKMISHQGACSDTTETNGRLMMEVNYDYSKYLLHHCTNKKIPLQYASSASVYGRGRHGFAEKPENEYPLNIYAFSKYMFDKYVRMYLSSRQVKSQVVGLRYFNVYGPQENHKGKMASVAYHLFKQIKQGQPMKLFEGSEKFLRDFIHVDDIVKVNMFFVDAPNLSGIYNCGTGRAESFQAVADTVKAVFPEARQEYIPFPDELKGKYQEYTQADMSSLRNIGYKDSFMSVEEGVRKYMGTLMASGGYIA